MNLLFRSALAAAILGAPLTAGPSLGPPASRGLTTQNRIAFQIAALEDTGSQTRTVSRSEIEGPPGTDFTILIHGSKIKVDAEFLTDSIADAQVRLRAKVKVDRLYGQSEHGLPLYEEAEINGDEKIGFDEAVRLYPFGRSATDNFRIEITPVNTANPVYDQTGQPVPLSIKTLEVTPGNPVNLTARKQPHHFTVKALLLEDGTRIGQGQTDCLLKEPTNIVIAPVNGSNTEPMTINLNVTDYMRDRPSDDVTVGFNLYRAGGTASAGAPLISNWSGTFLLGSPVNYDLSGALPAPDGHKLSLELEVGLGPGEIP